MKQKNAELRDVIEQEKQALSTKIEQKMQSTLEMAVQDRVQTQKQLSECEQKLQAAERQILDLQN